MLPTVVLFGLGLSATVAPLTATVLRPEPEHPVAQPECVTCLPLGAPPLEPGNQVEAPAQGH